MAVLRSGANEVGEQLSPSLYQSCGAAVHIVHIKPMPHSSFRERNILHVKFLGPTMITKL